MSPLLRIVTITTALATQALITAALAEPQDDTRVLCKTEMRTGSHLPPPRVCMTREQWKEVEKQRRIDITGELFMRGKVKGDPDPNDRSAPQP